MATTRDVRIPDRDAIVQGDRWSMSVAITYTGFDFGAVDFAATIRAHYQADTGEDFTVADLVDGVVGEVSFRLVLDAEQTAGLDAGQDHVFDIEWVADTDQPFTFARVTVPVLPQVTSGV